MDRANEVNRILGAFKLNPFEQLGLRFDATLDEAKRQYRKASLLVRSPCATGGCVVDGLLWLAKYYSLTMQPEALQTLALAQHEQGHSDLACAV